MKNIEEMSHRQNAISWLLHALKIILGDESIRRYIILNYYPKLKKKYTRTFNAFVKERETREDKAKQIIDYCEDISTKKYTVVFTATNIQQNSLDLETHFQSYIVDNSKKLLVVIDPAFDNKKLLNAGIYMAEVSLEVVIPFFQSKEYTIQFASLTTPAQISEGDVFCQSWSLYILLHELKDNNYVHNSAFEIPKTQIDKYDMLLQFYKQIITDIPELRDNLKTEYVGEIMESTALKSNEKRMMLKFDPVKLLLSMNKYEMM